MPDHEPPSPHGDLAGYVLGALEPDEARAFESHLGGCDACRAEVDDLARLPALLAAAAPPVEVPAGLRERTLGAVAAEPLPSREPAPARPTRTRRSTALPRWLGVAAAVLVVLVGANVVVQRTQEQPAVASIVLVDPDGGPARGVARVRDTAAGRIVDLEVQGLAPAPPGAHYECWFVGEGDSPEQPERVSVGTFRVDERGRARLRMVSAADPQRFPQMGVTLEPDDGNPARTGPKALVSAARR